MTDKAMHSTFVICFPSGKTTTMQESTKSYRLSWLTNSSLVYEPKCGGGGGWVAGSQPLSTAVLRTGAQINFVDLTPYLSNATLGL
jgi:hypothetical protein